MPELYMLKSDNSQINSRVGKLNINSKILLITCKVENFYRTESIKIIALFMLSYIINEKDNTLVITSIENIKLILKNLKMSLQNPNHYKSFGIIRISVYDFIRPIGNLAAVSDQTVKYLVDEGIIPLISQSLTNMATNFEYALFEKTYSARLAWIIVMSSKGEYKEALSTDKVLIECMIKFTASRPHISIDSAFLLLWFNSKLVLIIN